MQLVELQEAWGSLEEHGVAIFGISYDSVEILAAFAEKRGITYPLLSDEGSQTIRGLSPSRASTSRCQSRGRQVRGSL